MDEQQDGTTAYHGSPHDFDEFDTSKIGTGEGAQSYGHGLYFAEHEPVAVGYRDKLTQGPTHVIFPQGDKDEWGNPIRFYPEELTEHESAAAKAVLNREGKQGQLEWLKNSPIERDEAAKAMRLIRNGGIEKAPAGHMYEVHINAHPHHLLDWDKPLSEQSGHIMKSLFATREEIPVLWKKVQHHINNDSTAGDFYQSIAAGHPHGYAGATEQLSRAGIKGIKYLDAGSRGDKAEPTHNYVVFDHKDVQIKRKYKQGGQVEGYAEGGDIMDDSRVKRTGEGGQETALDFIQNAPLYKQRIEDEKQSQPQAAPAPAPQPESKPMPVIAAPPPAIIRAAEPAPPAPVQQQPQAQGQTGLFHIGTNDTDPNLTVKSAQRIIDASRTMGIDPVFLLPNQSVKKPYAETSKALQKYLDDNGIQYHMPEYEPGDPAHMSHKWVNNFAKTYNNPFIAGDSNSVRLGTWGYGAKGTALVHPDSKAVLGRVGAGSKTIADELEKHLKWYQQNAPQHLSDGGEVDRRQMHHILAHHAELGNLSDPEYHYALGGNIGHREHFEDGGDPSGGDNQGSSVGDPSSDNEGGNMGGNEGGGGSGNDNAGAPSDAPVAEEKPGEVKPPPLMPLTPQNMGTNLGYDSIPNATFTPTAPTALPPTTSFQQFAGGGLVDAALKKISNKYTDTGLPLNAMEILSKIARTG
jgi:hypothetical protein